MKRVIAAAMVAVLGAFGSVNVIADLLGGATVAETGFERGEDVVFEDNFADLAAGDAPSHWMLLPESAEIAVIDGVKALKMNPNLSWMEPLIKGGNRSYLGMDFTMEFDILYPNTKESEGTFEWSFMEPKTAKDNNSLCVTWYAYPDKEETVYNVAWTDNTNSLVKAAERRNTSASGPFLVDGKWHHIALSYLGCTLKLYVDNQLVVSQKMPIAPGWTMLWANGDAAKYITNVVITHPRKGL